MQVPVLVLNQNTKRESGRKVQLGNIQAAKAVADIIRTTLGPRSMLKMLLDPMGGILLTNDGNSILREVDVSHPAAKSMIELSRTQDEEVGDGTTSVIILAGELLVAAEPFLSRSIHPTVIVRAYYEALEYALKTCESLAVSVDINDREAMMRLLRSAIGTKFSSRFGDLICGLALDSVLTVMDRDNVRGTTEVDLKRYVRVEKIPGGELSESRVIRGVMLNKDVTHPSMRRRIEHPRIVLLDCGLDYKQAESVAHLEISAADDWDKALKNEEASVRAMCEAVIAVKPDLVITEKGVSDLAQHYLQRANITALRRVRKSDNNRLAKATGATIVHRPEELLESDVGSCGLFEVRQIGDEYFAFVEECASPKACSVLLRGGSKDALNEIERNLQDAMQVARNVVFNPRVLPGGGATEMEVACRLQRRAKEMGGVESLPFAAVGEAMEVIPRTLCQNCGADTIRVITKLRAEHENEENGYLGVDGIKGCIADMRELGVWDTFEVKTQTMKTAIESACMLLRIDDIVSGLQQSK